MKRFIERVRWWMYHPRFELIYLLGGVPKQHIDTINYRNVESVVDGLMRNLEKYG